MITSAKGWKLHSRGQTVRGLTDGSHHVILEEFLPVLGLTTGHHVVVGLVESGAQQVRHGAVNDSEGLVCRDLGAQDLTQKGASVGHQGPAGLQQDLVLRLP